MQRRDSAEGIMARGRHKCEEYSCYRKPYIARCAMLTLPSRIDGAVV